MEQRGRSKMEEDARTRSRTPDNQSEVGTLCDKESPPLGGRMSSRPPESFFYSLSKLPLYGNQPTKSPMESSSASASSGPEYLQATEPAPIEAAPEVTRGNLDKRETKGTIKLNISNLSELKNKVTSQFYTIANLPFRLAAKTEISKRTSNTRFFSIYIDCNPESESTLWYCTADVEFRLLSNKPRDQFTQDFTRHFTNTFSYHSNNWGFPSFIEFDDISNPEKGFIKNDKVNIEAHITIKSFSGVSRVSCYDFTSKNNLLADGILVINGTRLYISKQYLALYSPVFEAMFFGNFAEGQKKEIVLEDVLVDEFLELLRVVYPSHKAIDIANVEFLLELGDRYQIQYVIDQCESFLQNVDDIAVIVKLVWADQFNLSKLQHSCLRTLNSPNEIKALKTTEDYRKLSDTTRAALLEKMFKLM